MAFSRPKLSEIVERIKTDMESGLGLTGASLRRSNVSVLAKAYGGAVHLLHGHLEWISKQIIIDTADADYLERHAQIWGVTRRAADYAQGSVIFAGSDGSVIPSGTVLRRSDEVEYTTDEDGTISSGTATVPVTAVLAGASGNSDSGVSLSLLAPIAGISGSATVGLDGLTNGIESEDDEALRERLIARIQQPPQGGAASDYEQWATSISGVDRAFVFPLYFGPGTVAIFIVGPDPLDPIPNAAKVAEVQEYIDELRPVTATPQVFAPNAFTVNFTIQLDPNTAAVRSAVTAEIQSLFQREAEVGGTILISHLNEVVSTSAGEVDHVLVSPTGNISVPAGSFPVLGTITFEAIP